MRSLSRSPLPVRRLALFGMAVSMTACLVLLRTAEPTVAEVPVPDRYSPSALLQRARNPVQLSLLTDPAKVVGWVSGGWDYAGQEVAVNVEGKVEKIRLAVIKLRQDCLAKMDALMSDAQKKQCEELTGKPFDTLRHQ